MDHNLLESFLGYNFKNTELLKTALRHSSARKRGNPSNEVFEFLGDSVVNFIAASYLVKKFPGCSEGSLTKMRSVLICEDSLYAVAKKLKLSAFMETENVTLNKRILSNCLEAIIGAVYIDGGKINVEKAWKRLFSAELTSVNPEIADASDPKSQLQEKLQKNKMPLPVYNCKQDGDGFRCEITVGGKAVGVGRGTSKKSSQVDSARKALKNYPL